jgi:hypothetical protein
MHIEVGVALSTRILKSQRGVVVGFIVSTLSWAEPIPRLTGLGLSPNDDTVSDIVKGTDLSAELGIKPSPENESIASTGTVSGPANVCCELKRP